MRLVNFAHGDFITVGAYALIVPSAAASAMLFVGGWPWPLMVLATAAVVVAVALLAERIVFRPLRTADPSTMLIASFSLSFFIQYLILLVYGGRPKGVDVGSALNEQIAFGGVRIALIDLVTIGVTIAMLAGIALFITHTRFGVQMRAATQDFRMARMLGVRANVVIAIAFAISGLLAAAVSLLLVARTGTLSPRMGSQLAMIGFVATVIGGMGSLVGSVLGGFLVGVSSALLQVMLPQDLRPSRDAFVFLLVILVLLFRPQGLISLGSQRERV
jgi:branched-chain amino acid transport system permease protein